MVTRIRKGARHHLYIEEWMAHRGLNDEVLGGRLGKGRTTMWRWRTEQHRLNPEKIAAIAKALDLAPEELWRPPGQQSLDALVESASDDLRATVTDVVKRLVGQR
jgi:transcriptional regulator with XRE-family HTH domain